MQNTNNKQIGCGETDCLRGAMVRCGDGEFICESCAKEIMKAKEVTDEDREFIADQINQGYTSGTHDNDGVHLVWSINIDKFIN